MKITTSLIFDNRIGAAKNKVKNARNNALRDTVVAIAGDAIKGSPVLTGNNRRSIAYEVGPGGVVATKAGQGAVYSTSGYGGFLETGTSRMNARPYFKPALDKNIGKLASGMKAELK